MAWLFIGFAEVDDYQEDGIELLTKYSKIKKLYKNKSIPSSIKLLLNLNWAFNYEDNDNMDSDDYNTWLDSIIDILTTVKENHDVIPWVLHSIDNAGIDIDSLLSLALNIYHDPDAFKVKESHTQVSKQLYEATEAIEDGIEEFNDNYSEIVKARAFKKVDELSKQKFNSVTETKPVKHVDNKHLM